MKETKVQIMAGIEGVKSSKIIGANTVEYVRENGDRVIRLHHTDIVTFKPNSDIVLNSGGWKTPTTKDRMNSASPKINVQQRNSVWFLGGGDDYPFADGITIHPDGNVTGEGPDPKKTLKLKAKIKEYVAEFMAALELREIPQPSGGDCWACCMKNDKGETVIGSDHILGHIKEKYYVPSLLMTAIEKIPVSPLARSQVGYWLKYHEKSNDWLAGIAHDQVAKSLKRYLYRQLNMAA